VALANYAEGPTGRHEFQSLSRGLAAPIAEINRLDGGLFRRVAYQQPAQEGHLQWVPTGACYRGQQHQEGDQGMPLSFCAIDFETANSYRGSPCAVGLVKVVDGQMVEARRVLMRPPAGYDDFDPFNIQIHGITATMVRDQPRFAERLPEILAFAGGLPFVAHNAAFDMGVIRDACDASELAWPETSYACTLVFSRATWSLLSYSLPWVAEAAGIPFEHHHEPAADARAAASIMLAIALHVGAASLEDIAAATHTRIGSMSAADWSGCHRPWSGGLGDVPVTNAEANPAHPFYGREIVFTGALGSMTRALAWDRVAEAGGRPAPGVTKHTNVLVIGYQDARKLRPGEALSAKARKARDLRERGQKIEIMPEVDFVQLLAL
jgi:DNA polymerase-3 subunit epsilon